MKMTDTTSDRVKDYIKNLKCYTSSNTGLVFESYRKIPPLPTKPKT